MPEYLSCSKKFSKLSTAKDILGMKEKELDDVKKKINRKLDKDMLTINELKDFVFKELNNHLADQDQKLFSFRKIMTLIFAPHTDTDTKKQTMTYMVGGMFEK